MVPRECDNDNCDYNDYGRWEHVEGCEPMPPLSPERLAELKKLGEQRPNTLLGSLVRGGMCG
jgi:hypothetical protein